MADDVTVVADNWTSAVAATNGSDLDLNVFERYESNRRVDAWIFYTLIVAYCLLIAMGTAGNFLVVYVVARKPAMRTPRNVFIINLACSDMLLCLITMPLTFVAALFFAYVRLLAPVETCTAPQLLRMVTLKNTSLSIQD